MQKLKAYKSQIEEYEKLQNAIEDLEVLIELALEEEDFNVYKEIKLIMSKYLRKQKI